MRVRLLTPLLLVAALAAGCGEDQEQPQALPSVAVTTATTAPSPTSAPVPTEAQAETPQGAAAFARHWFDTLNAAAQTGQTGDLRALGYPGCEACNNFAESIDVLYTDGGGIRGGVFTVVAAESPDDVDVAEATVTVVYDVTPTEQLAKDGSVDRQIEALQKVEGEMTLVRGAGGWLVRELITQ